MGDIYISARDNVTKVEVLKIDERASTFMVRYMNGDKKGQTTIYSKGTMKRWWKKVDKEQIPTKSENLENKTKKATSKKKSTKTIK